MRPVALFCLCKWIASRAALCRCRVSRRCAQATQRRAHSFAERIQCRSQRLEASTRKTPFPVELWPAQLRIAAAGLLRGRSALVQMPTSAGKTRATEVLIRSAFLANRASLAVIVAPYRSLCHDIRGDLSLAFAGEPISLDEASNSYQLDLELEALFANNTILIVTPEKSLYMLRRAPELAQRIGLVIYDEGHQFDGMARGPTYELLLTSLKMALSPEPKSCLSRPCSAMRQRSRHGSRRPRNRARW